LLRATSLNRSCVRRTRWKRLIGSRVCCFAALRWLQRRVASSIVSQSLAITLDNYTRSRENRAMRPDLASWIIASMHAGSLHPYESLDAWILERSRANWMRPSTENSLSFHSREGERRISSITIQGSIKQQRACSSRNALTRASLETESCP